MAKGDSPFAQALITLFRSLGMVLAAVVRIAITDKLTRRNRREHSARVRSEIERTRGQANRLAVLAVTTAYRNGAAASRQRAPGPSRINQEAIDTLTESLTESLENAAQTVGRRIDDVFRREGLRAALGQATDELPESAAVRKMKEALERRGIASFTDRAGREWDLERYCRMVVRTTTAEAYTQGVVTQMLAQGLDLYQVIGEHDCQHHPSDPNHPCRAYEGKVFSLTGNTPGFEKPSVLPPYHPACRHGILPAVDAVDRLLAAA